MSLNGVNRNIMRLSGLNSGLDTESIVSSLLQASKNKVNKQLRNQYALEWKQTAHKDINNELRKLKEEFSTVLKQEQNLISEQTYKKYSVNYQTANDTAYAAISAATYVEGGSYTIDEIVQLATSSHVESSFAITGTGGQGLSLTATMNQVHAQIQATMGGAFEIDTDGKINFKFDGKDYSVEAGVTLGNLLNVINSNSTNLQISYSQAQDKFTVSSKATGTGSNLDALQDDPFLMALGINKGNAVAGQNSIIKFNGHATPVERQTNSYELNGLNITLKKVTPPSYNLNFEVERDVDHTVNAVKKYVESYNALMTKLNDLITEKVDRNYHPLTDDEKAEMTEKQIEQWEEKAKAGMLRNNSQLQRLISDLRTSFVITIPGYSKSMSDIGIGTTIDHGYDDAVKGVIYIDEITLRESLRTDPDSVYQMFTFQANENEDQMGLVSRINTLINNYINYNEDVTQELTGREITAAKERYNTLLNIMYDEEERLWAKFTALETAMSSMNAQSNALTQQLSSMMGSK